MMIIIMFIMFLIIFNLNAVNSLLNLLKKITNYSRFHLKTHNNKKKKTKKQIEIAKMKRKRSEDFMKIKLKLKFIFRQITTKYRVPYTTTPMPTECINSGNSCIVKSKFIVRYCVIVKLSSQATHKVLTSNLTNMYSISN